MVLVECFPRSPKKRSHVSESAVVEVAVFRNTHTTPSAACSTAALQAAAAAAAHLTLLQPGYWCLMFLCQPMAAQSSEHHTILSRKYIFRCNHWKKLVSCILSPPPLVSTCVAELGTITSWVALVSSRWSVEARLWPRHALQQHNSTDNITTTLTTAPPPVITRPPVSTCSTPAYVSSKRS